MRKDNTSLALKYLVDQIHKRPEHISGLRILRRGIGAFDGWMPSRFDNTVDVDW
jgi:hypothetical protein